MDSSQPINYLLGLWLGNVRVYANRIANIADIGLMNFFRDPLVRRFISATIFAAAFVWVAVAFFDVETEVMRVFFIYSVGLVVLMVLAALVLFPIIGLFRKKRSSLLERPSKAEDE